MRGLVVAFLFLLLPTNLYAQTITAGDIEDLCQNEAGPERTSCLLTVKIYMDGFIEGIGKGVIDTYKYDPQVFALVKDEKMKDMALRINKVADLSTCIQRVSVADMVDSYIKFMRQNPSIRDKNYREAMTYAIVAAYCPK